MSRKELLKLAAHKRAQAVRFRSMASGLSLLKDQVTIAEYAGELEREAGRLEAEAAEQLS